MLCLFLLSAVLIVLSVVANRPTKDAKAGRIFCVSLSVALLLFAILLVLNDRLDRSLPNEVRTTVIRKAVLRGRHGAKQYNLTVSSWRPGRSLENFNFALNVFNGTAVGKIITVEMHDGFFGIPWHGKISPE